MVALDHELPFTSYSDAQLCQLLALNITGSHSGDDGCKKEGHINSIHKAAHSISPLNY